MKPCMSLYLQEGLTREGPGKLPSTAGDMAFCLASITLVLRASAEPRHLWD